MEVNEPTTPNDFMRAIPIANVTKVPMDVAINILLVSFNTLRPAVSGRVKKPRKK